MDFVVTLTSARNERGKVIVDERFSFPGQFVTLEKEEGDTIVIDFTNCAVEHPISYFGIRNRLNNFITCNVSLNNVKYPITKCTPQKEEMIFKALGKSLTEVIAKESNRRPDYKLSSHTYRKSLTMLGHSVDAPYPINKKKYGVDLTIVLGKEYHFIERVRVQLPEEMVALIIGSPLSRPPSPTTNIADAPTSNGSGTVADRKRDEQSDNDDEEEDDDET